MSNRQENVAINEATLDQEITANSYGSKLVANKYLKNVKTLKRCFNKRIDKEMVDFVDTVEDSIQNEILTAIDTIITPKIELPIRSINASS